MKRLNLKWYTLDSESVAASLSTNYRFYILVNKQKQLLFNHYLFHNIYVILCFFVLLQLIAKFHTFQATYVTDEDSISLFDKLFNHSETRFWRLVGNSKRIVDMKRQRILVDIEVRTEIY